MSQIYHYRAIRPASGPCASAEPADTLTFDVEELCTQRVGFSALIDDAVVRNWQGDPSMLGDTIKRRLLQGLHDAVPEGMVLLRNSIRTTEAREFSEDPSCPLLHGMNYQMTGLAIPQIREATTQIREARRTCVESAVATRWRLNERYGPSPILPALPALQSYSDAFAEMTMTTQELADAFSTLGGALGDVGISRHRRGEGPREERAFELLKTLIPEVEYTRYQEKGCAVVKGRQGVYVVSGGYNHKVRRYKNYRSKAYEPMCLNLKDHGYTPTDLLIARIMLIKNSEKLFLTTAVPSRTVEGSMPLKKSLKGLTVDFGGFVYDGRSPRCAQVA